MKTLAIDFSSSRRGVALLDLARDGLPLVAASIEEAGSGGLQALELVERVLQMADWKREEIECLAIGLGPGSYTGIRASIALVQGWQIARPVRTLGLSSMDVLAETAREQGHRGRIAILVDAQRHEFYLSQYDLGEDSPRPVPPNGLIDIEAAEKTAASSSEGLSSSPICLVSTDQARQVQKTGALLAGPDLSAVFPEALPVYPEARRLGIMSLGRTHFVPANELTPIYLRPISFVKAPPPRFKVP